MCIVTLERGSWCGFENVVIELELSNYQVVRLMFLWIKQKAAQVLVHDHVGTLSLSIDLFLKGCSETKFDVQESSKGEEVGGG